MGSRSGRETEREAAGCANGVAARFDDAEQRELDLAREEIARLKAALARKVRNEAQIAIQVRDALRDLPAIRVPSPQIKVGRGSEEAAILAIGDTQVGKHTRSYDIGTAEKRVLLAGEKTLKITEMRRGAARIETLHLWLLGDLCEGEMIYPGQSYEIECGAAEQATKHVPRILSRLVGLLAQGFKRIVIRGVAGNHGRVGLPSQNANPRTNWDRVALSTTELHLGPLIKSRRVDWAVADDFYCVVDVLGHGHMITHGDETVGSGTDASLKGCVGGWIDSIPEEWEVLWVGHLHNFKVLTVNYHTAIINGSPESGNTYAQRRLKAANHPMQTLAFASREHGLISINPLYLREKRR